MMHLEKSTDLTLLVHEFHKLWSEYKEDASVSEMRVLNKIFYYYDMAIKCGHKELGADLNIPSSALSKLLKGWLETGAVSIIKSKKDKRRNFYSPSEQALSLREINFNKIKKKLNQR